MLIPSIWPTEPTFDPSIANCDFESGLCLYTQDQVMGSSWRRVSVKPNIFRNGDHTTGAGGKKQLMMDFRTLLIFKPDLAEDSSSFKNAALESASIAAKDYKFEKEKNFGMWS